MNKFGNIQGLDDVKESFKAIEDKDLLPSEDAIIADDPRISGLTVKRLPQNDISTKYVGSSGNKPQEIDSEEPYPALEIGIGSMGLGGGSISKEMSRCESFDGSVDESPYDEAQDRTQVNTMEETKDMFKRMFGDTYEKYVSNTPKINDVTKPEIKLKGASETFKIKRGW